MNKSPVDEMEQERKIPSTLKIIKIFLFFCFKTFFWGNIKRDRLNVKFGYNKQIDGN